MKQWVAGIFPSLSDGMVEFDLSCDVIHVSSDAEVASALSHLPADSIWRLLVVPNQLQLSWAPWCLLDQVESSENLVHDLIPTGTASLVKWPLIVSGVLLVCFYGETGRGAWRSERTSCNRGSSSLIKRWNKFARCKRTTCISLKSNAIKKAEESISKTMDQPNSHSNNHQWLASRAAVELWPVVNQNGTARHLDHGSQLAMRVFTVARQWLDQWDTTCTGVFWSWAAAYGNPAGKERRGRRYGNNDEQFMIKSLNIKQHGISIFVYSDDVKVACSLVTL